VKFFWIINGKRFKQYLIIVVSAFFAAAIVYVEGNQLSVFFNEKDPSALYKVETKEKKVSLSFDISWGDEKVHDVLKVLKSQNLKTTFFVSGEWAERHPDIVDKIIKDGHELGSLGYRYKSYTDLEDNQIRRDITMAKQVIEGLTNEETVWLRPPNGKINKRVLEIATKNQQTVILWSNNPKDYQNPGVDEIVKNVMENVDQGDIILLHASDRVKHTIDALPAVIKGLKSKGYELVNVTELVRGTKADSKEIK
jgi:polysaccharide deacetylase family sporulation protein PdaB